MLLLCESQFTHLQADVGSSVLIMNEVFLGPHEFKFCTHPCGFHWGQA